MMQGQFVDFVRVYPPAQDFEEKGAMSGLVGTLWRDKPDRCIATIEVEGDPDAVFQRLEEVIGSGYFACLHDDQDKVIAKKQVSAASVEAHLGRS